MTPHQAWKIVAVLFGLLAVAAGIGVLRLHWLPGVDFDLIGFFWVIRNVGRLSLLALFVVCTAAALSFWIRAYQSDR